MDYAVIWTSENISAIKQERNYHTLKAGGELPMSTQDFWSAMIKKRRKPMEIDYTHLKCECGGIVGMYDGKAFTCEQCKKPQNINGKYDRIEINRKTGWAFPVLNK